MILPQAGLFDPPERLPRRAVRGLGAHSPIKLVGEFRMNWLVAPGSASARF